MTPSASGFLDTDFIETTQPTYTYKMELENQRIRGYTDEQEAMRQAIYKIIFTERYKYLIYSWNYGIELEDLFGQPISYVVPELERRITEALEWDDRITEVTDFEFDYPTRNTVHVSFIAHTIFGPIEAERTFDV